MASWDSPAWLAGLRQHGLAGALTPHIGLCGLHDAHLLRLGKTLLPSLGKTTRYLVLVTIRYQALVALQTMPSPDTGRRHGQGPQTGKWGKGTGKCVDILQDLVFRDFLAWFVSGAAVNPLVAYKMNVHLPAPVRHSSQGRRTRDKERKESYI